MNQEAIEFFEALKQDEYAFSARDKEMFDVAIKALKALDDIKSEIKFITDTNGVKHIHQDDVFKIIDRHMEGGD